MKQIAVQLRNGVVLESNSDDDKVCMIGAQASWRLNDMALPWKRTWIYTLTPQGTKQLTTKEWKSNK